MDLITDEISLLKIFTYLSIKSLNTCMCVCKSWYKLANEIKHKRKNTIQTILYYSATNENLSELTTKLCTQLDSFTVQPELSLIFLTNTTDDEVSFINQEDENSQPRPSKKPKTVIKPSNLLKKLLPPSKNVLMYTAGILGTNYNNTSTLEIETLNDELGISGIFFPKSEHYRINLLKLKNRTKIPEFRDVKQFNEYFSVKEEEEEELKYLVLIGDRKCKIKLDGLFKFINEKMRKKFAICGSYIDKFEFTDGSDDDFSHGSKIEMIILAFIGKSNLNISQIVIPYADEDEEKCELVTQKINELKTRASISENQTTFALQIACLSRGQAYYSNEENYESKVFKSFFPNIPLVGLFGYGELGVDYFKNCQNSESDEDVDWIGYSTIISIVSISA
jgi:hypothetical protein